MGSSIAAVSAVDDETQYDTNPPPGDARMHYADYNLFYNPDSPSQTDYSLAVEPDDQTPLTKGSDGFAKHDVHAAPAFKGPFPTAFPFDNADIEAGTTTVSMILAHYRDIYSPGAQSPLTGAGDPMGGANNNIGAIGQGSDKDPNDQFGTFMPGMGGGPPPLTLPDGGASGDASVTRDASPTSDASGTGDAKSTGDASATRDASGAGGAGATSGSDSGSPVANGSNDSGCGCRLNTSAPPHDSPWGIAVLFAAAAARARRRSRRRPPR